MKTFLCVLNFNTKEVVKLTKIFQREFRIQIFYQGRNELRITLCDDYIINIHKYECNRFRSVLYEEIVVRFGGDKAKICQAMLQFLKPSPWFLFESIKSFVKLADKVRSIRQFKAKG